MSEYEVPVEAPIPPSIGEALENTVDAVFDATLPKLHLTQGQDRGVSGVHRMMTAPGPGFFFMVGFAGTGKTTAMRVIARECGQPLVITPTGKAALRVREATRLYAQTIHRWLYIPMVDPKTGVIKFRRRDVGEIWIPPSRLVLLDEASMVGPEVWKDIYETVTSFDLKLVCIGDGFQLPPVQAKNAAPFSILDPAFAYQLNAERVELTEVLRQAQDSPVVRVSMALRNGDGYRALLGLHRVTDANIGAVAPQVHQSGGIIVCHTNQQRYRLNGCMRQALGMRDIDPTPGEPLLVLKNTYSVDLVNGEIVPFSQWTVPPSYPMQVTDDWKGTEEQVHFGAMPITMSGPNDEPTVINTVVVREELWGRMEAGFGAVIKRAKMWATDNGVATAPYLPVNFGYCYTVHKSQGSEWPFVLVVVEPSVRLDTEEGRRWAYTAVTRAKTMAAVYFGRV